MGRHVKQKVCVSTTSACVKKHFRNGKSLYIPNKCILETLLETRKLVCPPQALARYILEKRTLVYYHKRMLETLLKQVGLCIYYKSMLETLLAYSLPAQTRNTLETRKPAFITSACIKHSRDRRSLYLHHKHKLETPLKRESLCVHHKRILRYFREAKTCVPQAHAWNTHETSRL